MKKYHDLSFQIKNSPSCTFQVDDMEPKISFAEAAESSLFLISSKIDNLRMDIGSHVLRSGCIPNQEQNNTTIEIHHYLGNTLILDVSSLFKPIEKYFKEGKLNIDLNYPEICEQYIEAIDKIILTKKIFLELLEERKLSLDRLQGICFYTGLSHFWQYEKYEPWEHIFFLGLEFSHDLIDLLANSGLYFLGIDAFKLGHSFFNFCDLDKIFIKSEKAKKYFAKRLQELKKTPTKYALLKHGINLYQSLNIHPALANKYGKFFGLPLPISIESFNNMSLTYPIFSVEEE